MIFLQARRNMLRLRVEREWRHLPELYVSIVITEDIANVLINLTATVQKIVTGCYNKMNRQRVFV